MHLEKSPKPNGLNSKFYQHYWNIVGMDVSTACLNYLNIDAVLPELNQTNIILIPKTQS